MAMSSWSTNPELNVLANTGFSMDENMAPSAINNSVRQLMADVRTWVTTGALTFDVTTLANDGTPTVSGKYLLLTGGTTTITDFDDGVTGQIIQILSEHTVTITDGTNIFLNGSANFTMNSTDSLTLVCKTDNKWYEIGRSDNT